MAERILKILSTTLLGVMLHDWLTKATAEWLEWQDVKQRPLD